MTPFVEEKSILIGLQLEKKGNFFFLPWGYFRNCIAKQLENDQGLDMLALAIYGLVIFPRTQGLVKVAVIDLFEQVQNRNNTFMEILAEIIILLNFCR